ncbi:hypothetical protein JVT61DRAFT_6658 [Boletus reticuloceps]|uniref:Wax synthase domain-containing protein n=1 Tax=Boletus reticuloceps TaxID=495285 RepID=A0A8I2YKG0_9AGAM|nr:hypothetical protein JVT61DRAFT_6658 [Boletus reticuloceps]
MSPRSLVSAHKTFYINIEDVLRSWATLIMSFQAPSAVMSMWNALGLPSTRIPNDSTVFVSHVLPPVVCYFALAVLAVTPQMHAVRVANMASHLSALRIQLSLEETYAGYLRPQKSSPSIIVDALDLASSYRGHGWEWSRGLYIQRETRPVTRLAFAFYAFLSGVAHTCACGVFHRAVLSLLPVGAGSIPGGSTLFDESLPLLRYLRASLISIFIAIAHYASMQIIYDLCTVFGIPWFATSLSDFWGRRWHQFYAKCSSS